MTSTLTLSPTTTITTTTPTGRPPRLLRKTSTIKSTPNLNAAYRSSYAPSPVPQSRNNRPPVPKLGRKPSLSAFTKTSLAKVLDVTESYLLDSVLLEENLPPSAATVAMPPPPPITPGRPPLAVGTLVNVPGNMHGTVRFIGPVDGKRGIFAGVELHPDFAARGKNSGDVDGVKYFTTTVEGAGIFLPVEKALRRDSPATSTGSLPLTPAGLRVGNQNSLNHTPPSPVPSKLGSSAVLEGRAKTPSRRPGSPVRAPGSRPTGVSKAPPPMRYVTTPTPTAPNRFAQSVRGTAGDPAKGRRSDKSTGAGAGAGPRSASAIGQVPNYDEEDISPAVLKRTRTNGSVGSVSSFGRIRPQSRANDHTETDGLRAQLEERDRQLMEQARTLAEMENSLAEVQSLMMANNPDGLTRRGSADDKNVAQLRGMLREKNDKIAMLTAEFDAHRADFRSTIDALETASTETQKLYEKRIEELTQEVQDLETSRLENLDVSTFANQLKQLEEFVQELEEGLEDARRGEAEARGEAEFLRGEVERTRAELRRERERMTNAALDGSRGGTSKELEQKDDEIRGLKAIIHSLSRDSVPGGGGGGSPADRPTAAAATRRSGSISTNQRNHQQQQQEQEQEEQQAESPESRRTRETLEHEIAELQSLLNNKSSREEELEREIETLRRASISTGTNRASALTIMSNRQSARDSRDTVVASPSPINNHGSRPSQSLSSKRPQPLEAMPENDTTSTAATETSTLWCEMCETGGHDVLSCTNFGAVDGPLKSNHSSGSNNNGNGTAAADSPSRKRLSALHGTKDGLIPLRLNGGQAPLRSDSQEIKPAPLSPVKPRTVTPSMSSTTRIIPSPMDMGPVAGKESGVIDQAKWCAVCERDGHELVDCPFGDAF